MKIFKKQKGMTLIGLLLVLVLVAAVALLVVRITPTYLEAWNVYQAFTKIKGDRHLAVQGKSAIRSALQKQLEMNSVYKFKLDDLKMEETKHGYHVKLYYERRIPLVLNIDVVMKFHPKAKVHRP